MCDLPGGQCYTFPMPIVIDDPATEALARDLARREGLTPSELIARALAERSARAPVEERAARAAAFAELDALRARLEARGGDWPAWRDLQAWGRDGRDG